MGVHLIVLLFTLSSLISANSENNITSILSAFPEYSQNNAYLTKTKLADEINNRQPVTVLVLNNSTFSTHFGKYYPLHVVKNALSIHVLLGYFDAAKLHNISNSTVLYTTLYQTTGLASGQLEFVNFSHDLRGGTHLINYTEVIVVPNKLSVVEISQAIAAPNIAVGAAGPNSPPQKVPYIECINDCFNNCREDNSCFYACMQYMCYDSGSKPAAILWPPWGDFSMDQSLLMTGYETLIILAAGLT